MDQVNALPPVVFGTRLHCHTPVNLVESQLALAPRRKR